MSETVWGIEGSIFNAQRTLIYSASFWCPAPLFFSPVSIFGDEIQVIQMSGVLAKEDKPIKHNQPRSKSKPSSEQLSLTERCNPPHCPVPSPNGQAAPQGAVWFYVPSSVHIKLHWECDCLGLEALNHMTHYRVNPHLRLLPQQGNSSLRNRSHPARRYSHSSPWFHYLFPLPALCSVVRWLARLKKIGHQSLIIAWQRVLWVRCRETVKGDCRAEELRAGRCLPNVQKNKWRKSRRCAWVSPQWAVQACLADFAAFTH